MEKDDDCARSSHQTPVLPGLFHDPSFESQVQAWSDGGKPVPLNSTLQEACLAEVTATADGKVESCSAGCQRVHLRSSLVLA